MKAIEAKDIVVRIHVADVERRKQKNQNIQNRLASNRADPDQNRRRKGDGAVLVPAREQTKIHVGTIVQGNVAARDLDHDLDRDLTNHDVHVLHQDIAITTDRINRDRRVERSVPVRGILTIVDRADRGVVAVDDADPGRIVAAGVRGHTDIEK